MAPSRGSQAFLRVGLPLMALTIGGWLGVAHVLSGKFELREKKLKYEELKPASGPETSLEAELERTRSKLDLDHFENKPVPKIESD